MTYPPQSPFHSRWMDGYMGLYGSANTGLRYMGARRDAQDRGYPLLFSIGPKGSLPCMLPQTVTHSPSLFPTENVDLTIAMANQHVLPTS